ncbi:Septation initiation network scaffold protein cdc11 [Lachnellula suecica]|uniref:Septation initiation network scaffold protein cdc11 n=1 Tax=Lachnellula suecica TaxID=602035 RepID=A0A8T9C475_9HELO|nr:Septation initiation network scaffold protein cdc11 [Lachnellula suecica]
MEQAWLDSLSEDWVSQPRSSGSPALSLPSLSDDTSESDNARAKSSRIPIYQPQKKSWNAGPDSPLSERSTNEHNIPLSQRGSKPPSKLRDELPGSVRGRHHSRTASASTTQSIQHHTVQHKSTSLSPKRDSRETPEWKRRLLQGDVAYGEQRDLFSPAGIENIFRPPQSQPVSPSKLQSRVASEEESVVMPSSPPPYNCNRVNQEAESEPDQGEEMEDQRRRQPRGVNYKLADDGNSEFSANDLSRSSSFQPRRAAQNGPGRDSDLSISQQEGPVEGAGRTVSGQSDMRNEELSPIYITRQNTIGGSIDYAANVPPAAELKQRLQAIKEDSPLRTSDTLDESSRVALEDMTADTDDFAHNGQFINSRRGGRSHEGSFQRRMLSPSSLPAIDESGIPEESMQASTPKHLPNIRKTRASNEYRDPPAQGLSSLPQTPRSSPIKSNERQQGGSSGSPLKLFADTYDTFTKTKLERRLSQFGGAQFKGDLNGEEDDFVPSASAQEPTKTELNEGFVAASSPRKSQQESRSHQRPSKRYSSFGEGELDDFQFSEEVSHNSSGQSSQDDDKENMSLPVLDPKTQTKFKFQLDPSLPLEKDVKTKRRVQHTRTKTTSTKRTISVRKTIRPGSGSSNFDVPPSQRLEDLETPRKRNGNSEGKRLPRSPLKDSTPKRRRTLQKNDISELDFGDDLAKLDSLKDTHQQMQSVIGKKRKDARHGDDQQAANPKVLAMRQILRPRTPTPSQRSSQQLEHHPDFEVEISAIERAKLLQDKKIAQIQAELDATDPLRLSTAFGVSQVLRDSRKGSVTTQDFLDEAKKIMAGIRGKARPNSGLTSLEESEAENERNRSPEEGAEDYFEESYQESTLEPFSRPPSRDGKPVTRMPAVQEDPALLDHLRKYQEKSDMDDVMASSIRTMAMAKEAVEEAKEIERITNETISRASGRRLYTEEFVESEPPNIRISENPEFQRKRKHSTSSIPTGSEVSREAEFPSQGSNASSGQSTSRTIPTGSSRGSDSRRVIAPHNVSHLIPEQLAGMVFDRERNIWVKRKSASAESGGQNFLSSDETEDDPFGDIPDLSVDETQERQKLKAVAAKLQQEAHSLNRKTPGTTASQRSSIYQAPALSTQGQASIDASKLSHFASVKIAVSSSKTTSTEVKQAPIGTPSFPPQPKQDADNSATYSKVKPRPEVTSPVEGEISIHEDRLPGSPERRRNVTITFSSPLTSIINPPDHNLENSFDSSADEPTNSDHGGPDDFQDDSVIVGKRGSNQRTSSTTTHTTVRKASRGLSLGRHTFSGRPVSRIDERDEEESGEGNDDLHRRSISVIVTTPASKRAASMALVTPRPPHDIGTLTLTPLSEFTVHQEDPSFGLNVSYVAMGQPFTHGNGQQRTLSGSIKALVEQISAVEPYEPFWEDMKQIELKERKLTTLHKLDEFCGKIEELDASHNQISQLHGAPGSVRHLRMTHNCLSGLTAWNHLSNLQCLVHLRGLRADNNKISSLDGIGQLDGLLSLRLRGNLLESLDFSNTRLQRLTDLDLKSNYIRDVHNIDELPSLSDLNLEDNEISSFAPNGPEMLWALKYLRLSGNNLSSIDVSPFPGLRLVYLDRNRLGALSGVLKAKHLDSISMREQKEGAVVDMSLLSEAFEVRKIFLSGNLLSSFEPTIDFLNLQYLELANCGLESLPAAFGQMFRNIRVLNLNFNALRDLKPLFGIRRLKRLYLAGNRLEKLKQTTSILSQFRFLSTADFRGNPLTMGFYPPLLDTSVAIRKVQNGGEIVEPFTIGTVDSARDSKYVGCLDTETKSLRRVYELLVLGGCPRLNLLDGLDVERSIAELRDGVWDSLLDSGVLSSSINETSGVGAEEGNDLANPVQEPEAPEELVPEYRWDAEDSFA